MTRRIAACWLLAGALILPLGCTDGDSDIVVYSTRNEQLIKPLFDRFSEQTGIGVTLVTDGDGPLIKRLETEGVNSPADILLTVDAGNLWFAKEQGLLQPLESNVVSNAIPAHLRDPDGYWSGISVRARTIVYSTERVEPNTIVGYADLAQPAWHGRLCLRTSKKVYNQSLVAMLIAEHGEQRSEQIVGGWVDNLATKVFSNDTQVIEAIAAGQCDIGIVNTYYFGRLLKTDPTLPVALAWPDQAANGVHVNVSGAALTRHAPHAGAARRLIEWLAVGEAQQLFAAVNLEYPANPSVATDPFVDSWGQFKANPINVARAGELQADAVRLMDRAGYQ